MTITTQETVAAYTGNGSTTAFPVPFAFFGQDELEVIERVIATGAETTKVLTSDYAVDGGDGTTGTVTAVTAPASTVEWHIRRRTSRVQEHAYVANDPFPARSHERLADRAVAMEQESARDIGRSLRVAKTDAAIAALPSSIDRAGMFLAFDDNGDPVMSDGGAEDAASAAVSAAAAASSASTAGSAASSASASASAASSSASAAAGSASDAAVLGGALLTGTSTTSLSIGTGSKAFTTQANKAWTLGMRLRAASDDGAKFMEGPVTAYSGTSLTLNVDLTLDSGTHADWNIGVAGARGATGAAGAGSGDLVSTNNLSDVSNTGTARSNLGAAASSTTISAGSGLTGGGSLASNRTISLDISGLTEETSIASGDFVAIQDVSAGALRKMTRSNLVAGISGEVSKLKQIQHASTSAVSTTSTAMPYDDTIPQNTEGAQFLTVSITPANASNRLLIEIELMVASTASNICCVALFQDSTANALAATGQLMSNANDPHTVRLRHEMAAGTTSATTFKVRAGLEGAGTLTVNGDSGSRKFSTLPKSSITVTEYSNS